MAMDFGDEFDEFENSIMNEIAGKESARIPSAEGPRLKNGTVLPWIGLGTRGLEGQPCRQVCLFGLDKGYRMLDTATSFENAYHVGKSIRKMVLGKKLTREDVLMSVRLDHDAQGREAARVAFDAIQKRIAFRYVDLILLNGVDNTKIQNTFDSWRVLESLKKEGRAQHVGICNFTMGQVMQLQKHVEVQPEVHQLEFNPLVYPKMITLVKYCQEHGMIVQAYAPFARGLLIQHQTVRQIAQKHSRTPSQVLLRWCIQHDCPVFAGSKQAPHIVENVDLFEFKLDDEDMNMLDNLPEMEIVAEVVIEDEPPASAMVIAEAKEAPAAALPDGWGVLVDDAGDNYYFHKATAKTTYTHPGSGIELRVDEADGALYTLQDFIEAYGGSADEPPDQWKSAQKMN